jgi:basic membrane protein A
VIAQYAGVTPEAFRNPGKGKELALSQYQQGVNVIFHASGSTGLGVFEAARAMGRGHYGIGVDADQYDEAPGFVLTSMVKGIDAVVFDTIERVAQGRFRGGIYSYGLREGGVGYVYDDRNKALIPDAVRARLLELERRIVAGEITVPSTRAKS